MALLFDALYITVILIPLAVACLTMTSPCFPPLLTSLLCRPNRNTGHKLTHSLFVQMSFSILEFAQCHLASLTATYYVILFLGTATSTLWLDCKALAESCATLEDQIILYRGIQIYEKIQNSCIRDRIFLTLALLGPLLQVLTGFAVIEVENSGNFSMSVVCGLLYCIMSSLTLFTFSITGQVNEVSLNWIAARRGLCKTKIERKTMRSLVAVRIQFGSNFVEGLTPLVVLQFCFQQTASLLLMRQ